MLCVSAQPGLFVTCIEAAMHAAIQLTRYLRHMGTEGSSLLTSEQYTLPLVYTSPLLQVACSFKCTRYCVYIGEHTYCMLSSLQPTVQ